MQAIVHILSLSSLQINLFPFTHSVILFFSYIFSSFSSTPHSSFFFFFFFFLQCLAMEKAKAVAWVFLFLIAFPCAIFACNDKPHKSPKSPKTPKTPSTPSTPTTPSPSTKPRTCPIDLTKLASCNSILGGILGTPTSSSCCSLLGLIALEADVCLCAALDINILKIIDINIKKLDLIVNILTACDLPVPKNISCP